MQPYIAVINGNTILRNVPATKICVKCGIEKSGSDFIRSPKMKHGLTSYCRECHNIDQLKCRSKPEAQERNRLYRRKNRLKERDRQLRKLYGITIEDFNSMFSNQGGKCKCCSAHQTELKKSLVVDHCHHRGMVRGLLCEDCNLALGRVKDNTNTLRSMIEYLTENQA